MATRFHQIGSRSGWKHSTNVPCGIDASRWRGDLRLLVMAHRDVERQRHRRHPSPLGRPAGPGRVEVADVDRALDHQVAAAAGGELALPGADAARRPSCADVAHRAPVVVPAARLLEPVQVAVGDEAREARRACSRVQPWLASAASMKSGPAGPRAARKRAASSSGDRPPTLNFMPARPRARRSVHLLGDGRRGCRSSRRSRSSACGSGSRPTGATAAGRAPCRPASQIAVSTPAQATSPRRRSRRMSNVAGRASSQQRSTAKASSPTRRGAISSCDDRLDLEQAGVLVAGVRLADEPARRGRA